MRYRTIVSRLAIVLAGLLGFAVQANACAICGCGAGGYYLGLSPLQTRNYVGLRYRSALFANHDPTAPAGYERMGQTQELFQTAEIVARYYVTPRLVVQAYLPMQWHRQTTAKGNNYTHGLGDALAFASYHVFSNLADTAAPALRHGLWLGLGVKTATGRFKATNAGERSVANAGFMLGTGSWDPMAIANYTVRRRRTGLSLDISGRYATANADSYTFGNRLTGALSLFTIRQQGAWGVMPSAGLYAEASASDHHYDRTVAYTGGRMLAGQLGLDAFYQTWTVGALLQAPLAQHLAGGSQQAGNRLVLQAGWAF